MHLEHYPRVVSQTAHNAGIEDAVVAHAHGTQDVQNGPELIDGLGEGLIRRRDPGDLLNRLKSHQLAYLASLARIRHLFGQQRIERLPG